MGIESNVMTASEEVKDDDAARSKDQGSVWMAQFMSGDDEALNLLMNEYHAEAIHIVRRLVRGNNEDAEDVMQEAWINVMNRSDTFDTSRPFKQWFHRLVRNTFIDWMRKKKRRARSLPFSQADGLTPQDDRVVDGYGHPCEVVPVQMEVRSLLADIVEKYRETIWQIDALGASTADVAIAAGRKEPTIRWRLCEGRRMFRELLAEQEQS